MRVLFFAFVLLFANLSPGESFAGWGGIFDSKEVRSRNLKPFFKWTDMLSRYEKKHYSDDCVSQGTKKCFKKEWLSFLNTLQSKNVRAKIDEVNRRMNQADYIQDVINWGVQDYWATPYQFLLKDGDCEDYAIAKYISLKLLGLSEDNMRIVVLQDTNLGIMHAILAVYVDGQPYILDNQIKQVVSADRIHHYVPIYSINENYWWRHRKN